MRPARARLTPPRFASPRALARACLGVAFVLPALTACAHEDWDAAGPVARSEHLILIDSLAIMLSIVVPVILATLAFAWWFRAGNERATYRPTWAYSGRLELLVWSIPALIILFLGGIAWVGSHQLDPARPLASKAKPVEIDVVSMDWKWLFIYPEQGVASVNQVVAPAGVPLNFRITSSSVMNVFFVPRLGSEIYSMNGMVTRLNLMADRPGTYWGRSAHYSGDGFSDMHFNLIALPPAQFAAWAAATRAKGPALDAAAYRGLLRQSTGLPAYTYAAVQPGLFDAVVRQSLPPGEGPRTGRPSPQVSPKGRAAENEKG